MSGSSACKENSGKLCDQRVKCVRRVTPPHILPVTAHRLTNAPGVPLVTVECEMNKILYLATSSTEICSSVSNPARFINND